MSKSLPVGRRSFGSPPVWGSLRTPAVHTAGGFTLVSAIFLLVVLAVMGASVVTLGSVQHAAAARDAQALRAYYAARSALEWAAVKAQAGSCPASPGFTLTEAALDGFAVSVSCTRTEHALGAAAAPYFLTAASASYGEYGGNDFVSRQLQAKVLVAP